ncbi:MAG: hypothetical protein ACR2PB_13465 [Desulfocapsaceae bacterium]
MNIHFISAVKKIINPVIRRLSFFFLLVFFFVASCPSVGDLQACTICVPYPERTLADRLLEYGEIIFATEVKNTPYLFSAVETIRGTGVGNPVKVFCDSSTRRKLKFIADSAVVLARKSIEEEWQVVTFANQTYQSFIRDLVRNSSSWNDGPGNQGRIRFFTRLLTSDHPHIQEQAYLEVGRAPYDMIKTLATDIPREQIYEFLGNFRFIEWHSLYILFLGQSRHPDDRAYIRKHVESAARLGMTTNLSAWLTAFIEAYPETGVAEVETWYFINSGRSEDELKQVMTSMSVLGSLPPIADLPLFLFRDKIVNSYETLLKNYPEMAGRVAKDLAMWQVNAHVDRLSEIKKENTLVEPSDVYLLDYYLSMAPSYQGMAYDRLK